MQCEQMLSSRIREKLLFMVFQVKENEENHTIFALSIPFFMEFLHNFVIMQDMSM